MVRATAVASSGKGNQSLNAMELKARELYGASAEKYGVMANKRDGGLMAANSDWKNVHIDSTNQASPCKKMN